MLFCEIIKKNLNYIFHNDYLFTILNFFFTIITYLYCLQSAFGFSNCNKDFLRMIFRLYDDEGKGNINFEEFLIVNYLICR